MKTNIAQRTAWLFVPAAPVPGSPVDLQYRFTLEGEKIARLEIAS
jgi:hypothetical protein